ncbi:hypothetical protein BB561_001080 [Smittium simulii]|uniref:EXPERA domain-containing protein n=1 Tax=Smittium simulii TaxID=133385 RepID=A0A2T9YW64_9FUNG|nr:hypothetical protein BB561_001080 [Smittium simulii]
MSADTLFNQQAQKHPYYPLDLSLPHYISSSTETPQLLIALAGLATAIIITGFLLSRGQRSFIDRFAFVWFFLCFFTHVGLEGYYVWNNKTLAGKRSFLADIWREYSLSDSRYLSSETCTLSLEAITAVFDGPMCLVVLFSMLRANFATRHLAQLTTSIAQLYGVVMYFSTSFLQNCDSTHPHPYYFWVYFLSMNLPWIIIPSILIVHSWNAITCRINAANQQFKQE